MRVLHIGNIANNGYIFSKLLRSQGIESCAISPDYTHIMGFPIWEEEKFELPEAQHFAPEFTKAALEIYPWFASGSWKQCVEKINIYLERDRDSEEDLSKNLTPENLEFEKLKLRSFYVNKVRMWAKKNLPIGIQTIIANSVIYYIRKLREFNQFKKISRKFDVVVFYGPSTYLISRKKLTGLSIALEHGTLREYVFSPYARARKSKQGYQNSDIVMVTNQDSLPSTKILGINPEKVEKIPHPNQDTSFKKLREVRSANFKTILKNPYILLPARHTYGNPVDRGKGTELMLQAVSDLVREFPDLEFKLVEWGNDVEASKQFLRNAGVERNIEWNNLKSRPLLRDYMVNSLAIIDQMKIQAYGALTADALGLGVPVITAHSCVNDQNFFGECAPVLAATTSLDIVNHVRSILNSPESLEETFDRSSAWYDAHLSSEVLLQKTMKYFNKEFR